MKHVIAGLLMALSFATSSVAQSTSATVEGTISSQIEAFKADDFDQAFTYASPTIQKLFGSVDRFAMMVRQGYPMVVRPSNVEFLERDQVGRVERQKVLIRDQAGQSHLLHYYLIQGPEGWLIDGVSKLPSPDVAV